jgi:uncharacterized membrane protein YfcA
LIIVAPATVSLSLLIAGVLTCLIAFRAGDHFAGRHSETRFRALLMIFLLAMSILLVIRSYFVA